MTDLSRCPFCSSSEIQRNSNKWGHFFMCDCGAHGPYGETPSAALMFWNERSRPRLFTGCLRDGVCRGVCRNTDCPNHDMVVAARLVVEPKEDDVLYPKETT